MHTVTYTFTDANGCVEFDVVRICVIDVRCGKKLDKVELCHVPEEDPERAGWSRSENVQTLSMHVKHPVASRLR